jgi:hypothetical protein
MDSPADRPQSPRPATGSIPGGKSLAWLVGLLFSAIAAAVAIVLAVALAAGVVVVAVMGGVLLALASLAARARIIEARNVGGHSWVAYGWDRRP